MSRPQLPKANHFLAHLALLAGPEALSHPATAQKSLGRGWWTPPLLEQEIAPALKAHFVSQETIKNRSSTSGGVRYTVPVNSISSEEATRFGLGNKNPGYKMMRNMGWKGGPLGKQNNGIATGESFLIKLTRFAC